MRRSRRRIAAGVVVLSAALAVAVARESRDRRPAPPRATTVAPIEPLRADAFVGPNGELRISWEGMTIGGEPRSEVRVRRADGRLRVVRTVRNDVVVAHGRVGEALAMALAARRQLRPDQSVALVNAPADFEAGDLADHPDAPEARADLVLVFVSDGEALARRTGTVASAAARGALIWIAYPKAGKLGTDLNGDRVRVRVAEHGLDTVRQVALDDVWSALRLKSA